MSTIRRVNVTITPVEQDAIMKALDSHAKQNWATARRTKSAAIRDYAEGLANESRRLEAEIVRRMYQHTETIDREAK